MRAPKSFSRELVTRFGLPDLPILALPARSGDDSGCRVKFDTATGAQFKKKGNAPSYTSVFAKGLIAEAEHDDRIVAITAAMPSGTGVDAFIKAHPANQPDTP